MTELVVLLWCLAVVGLGTLFGGVVSALSWRRGNAVGTAVGLGVVRAVQRVLDTRLSRTATGALVGACDGLLLAGTLVTAGLLIEPARDLIFSEDFRRDSLRILGLLVLTAVGFGAFAWVLAHAGAARFLEAAVGFGCLVALGWVVALGFRLAYPWVYGLGLGVLALLLLYVVFPARSPAMPPTPREPPEDGILEFRRPLPPDEHLQTRE